LNFSRLRKKNIDKWMNMRNLITETAARTLEIEVNTLKNLQNSFDADFVAVVEHIFQNPGRVVLSGIGKSALVAQKIVATLNSTGTPALFLHAADAIHGDLGMIQANDVVICLSKSGETPEIKVLAPLLRSRCRMLVAMVGERGSYLAMQAQYVLYTPVPQEADPNNLAPTASTTAQMVMGDALATALLALRGFSPGDFARFHPGGALGKQLYLRVSDLYVMHPSPMVAPEASLQAAIVEITSKRLGATAVVDKDQKLLGIITDGDLRRMLAKAQDFSGFLAQDVMSAQPKTIGPEAMAVEAMELMRRYSITQLAVVDEKYIYKGIIHLHDLLREGIA
jgi:arabinose-5-phosphate isomerase